MPPGRAWPRNPADGGHWRWSCGSVAFRLPCLRPRHASLLHAARDAVLAGTLDGVAANWKAGSTVDIILHPLFVIGEVVDLPLDEVEVVPVLNHVTNHMQFLEERLSLPSAWFSRR